MSQFSYKKNSQILQELMHKAGISSLKELSTIAGVSQLQLQRLQYGLLPKMHVEILLKIALALQVSVNELLTMFLPESSPKKPDKSITLAAMEQEYQRLQQQMKKQEETLKQEFQQSSIQALESWLLQWPSAAAAAKKNSQLSAFKLLPLVKPVEQLLKQWGVEAIASVDEEVTYDPQWHQLIEGTARSGDLVKVRYVGYRQGEKLLYRAKVSPIK
jgi:DNA-binding Xre family transcriptional regulator/molecular chaperone GrpE (heat shock protein)